MLLTPAPCAHVCVVCTCVFKGVQVHICVCACAAETLLLFLRCHSPVFEPGSLTRLDIIKLVRLTG